MRASAQTPQAYVDSLPEDRKPAIQKLRRVLRANLPKGFSEQIASGMLAYVVPHSLYPAGYHVSPESPLPFINLASQKNYIVLYHMGLYDGPLLEWFRARWQDATSQKLDMGKCCVRFKKPDQIPFELIAELAQRLSPEAWIESYERARAQSGKRKTNAHSPQRARR
jgi:hypothetical protein